MSNQRWVTTQGPHTLLFDIGNVAFGKMKQLKYEFWKSKIFIPITFIGNVRPFVIAYNLSGTGHNLLWKRHVKDMCDNKMELFVKNIDIVLGSIVSTVGKVYVFVWREFDL